jgi:hypothetical protein
LELGGVGDEGVAGLAEDVVVVEVLVGFAAERGVAELLGTALVSSVVCGRFCWHGSYLPPKMTS